MTEIIKNKKAGIDSQRRLWEFVFVAILVLYPLRHIAWGLDLWEQQVGIETDHGLSQADRRAAIKQSLVASGNTTAEMVRQLAEAITGYEARVIVNQDYSFSLEFLGEKNELADINVEGLRSVVEQIKPAHLRFVISGVTWGDIESVGLTWQYFETNKMTWAEFESKFCVHAKK